MAADIPTIYSIASFITLYKYNINCQTKFRSKTITYNFENKYYNNNIEKKHIVNLSGVKYLNKMYGKSQLRSIITTKSHDTNYQY